MYNNRTGLYKLINPQKFIPPADNHMKSFNESTGELVYKSGLELKSLRYCDYNKHVVKFSLEPFPIPYRSPKDSKIHRYYVDLYMEFSTGDRFIVEIKSKGETVPPKKPKKKTSKAIMNYKKAQLTYAVNEAKWKEAEKFASERKMRFIILTEEHLS